jgi:hypothetical protein
VRRQGKHCLTVKVPFQSQDMRDVWTVHFVNPDPAVQQAHQFEAAHCIDGSIVFAAESHHRAADFSQLSPQRFDQQVDLVNPGNRFAVVISYAEIFSALFQVERP